MNTIMALNFMRSANAPQIRAGVMMKNMPWNSMWVITGIVKPWASASCDPLSVHEASTPRIKT